MKKVTIFLSVTYSFTICALRMPSTTRTPSMASFSRVEIMAQIMTHIVPKDMLNKVKVERQCNNATEMNKRHPMVSRVRKPGLQVREIVFNSRRLTKCSWKKEQRAKTCLECSSESNHGSLRLQSLEGNM